MNLSLEKKVRKSKSKGIIMSEKRKKRTRFKLKKVSSRSRLSVFRSNNHIYAQVIDDTKGLTLASASSLENNISNSEISKKELAELVGKKNS
jgi:large subunit ribosomal protein L18